MILLSTSDVLIISGTVQVVVLRCVWEFGYSEEPRERFMERIGWGILTGCAIAISGYAIAFGVIE